MLGNRSRILAACLNLDGFDSASLMPRGASPAVLPERRGGKLVPSVTPRRCEPAEELRARVFIPVSFKSS
jgi:hypothetical protein